MKALPAKLQPSSTTIGASENGGSRRLNLVVVGASAGGVEVLSELMSAFPADFPAAVFVVLHVMAHGRSVLADILDRAGALPVRTAVDEQEIAPGTVLVVPSDRHLLVDGDRVRVVGAPRECGHRPAIDPLFRSAAHSGGGRVIGVVLSGLLDDGAAGLAQIKDFGGAAVVQDPLDALFADMPRTAIAATEVDRVVSAADIPAALVELLAQRQVMDDLGETRAGRIEGDPTGLALVNGPPMPLSCPVCGEALWENFERPVLRFTCQSGHAFSAESMLEEQGYLVEAALRAGLHAMQAQTELLRRVGARQHGASRTRFELRTRQAEAHARHIRGLLHDGERLGPAVNA